MAKPSEHPGFRDLLQEWTQLLKESGFRDIEEGEDFLKHSGSMSRMNNSHYAVRFAKKQYYMVVADCVRETEFKKPLEGEILRLHADGYTQCQIMQTLGIKGNRSKVYKPIWKWLKAWGLK